MNDENLDQLLAVRRELPVPSLPANFQWGVWREIRRRDADTRGRLSDWFDWLLEPLFRPTLALSSVALAFVMGIGLGSTALAEARNAETRFALGLQVFGSKSPALPSTLMGYVQ